MTIDENKLIGRDSERDQLKRHILNFTAANASVTGLKIVSISGSGGGRFSELKPHKGARRCRPYELEAKILKKYNVKKSLSVAEQIANPCLPRII